MPTLAAPDATRKCRRVSQMGNHREFLDAIESRDLNTTCNHRCGHNLSKYGLLANIAYCASRRLCWDDEQEHIFGDAEGNQFLMRNDRKPWGIRVQPRPKVTT
jgi:hypothetical protein